MSCTQPKRRVAERIRIDKPDDMVLQTTNKDPDASAELFVFLTSYGRKRGWEKLEPLK